MQVSVGFNSVSYPRTFCDMVVRLLCRREGDCSKKILLNDLAYLEYVIMGI